MACQILTYIRHFILLEHQYDFFSPHLSVVLWKFFLEDIHFLFFFKENVGKILGFISIDFFLVIFELFFFKWKNEEVIKREKMLWFQCCFWVLVIISIGSKFYKTVFSLENSGRKEIKWKQFLPFLQTSEKTYICVCVASSWSNISAHCMYVLHVCRSFYPLLLHIS